MYSLILFAVCNPDAMALTTSDAPLAASPQTKTFSGYCNCSGLRKPIASSTRSALMISGLPFSTMIGLPPFGSGAQSISCTLTPVSIPFSPRNSRVLIFHLRMHPSSWLLVVFRMMGQLGHGVEGLCPTGGFGIISICVTRLHPWR